LNSTQQRLTHYEHYYNNGVMMIHGDCMDVMAEIGEKEIPLAIVDPPYGIGASNRINKTKKSVIQYKPKNWDNKTPTQEYFTELFRVSRNQIIFGGNFFKLPQSRGFFIWDKCQPLDVDQAMCEYIWTSLDVSAKIVRESIQQIQFSRIHPTEKPIQVYKWLLSRYAKHGELILDTHGGSGSICIACHDLGHPIIWIEKDADYYRDAVKRVKTHQAQETLFAPEESKKETQEELF
jgi:site-specific DNA-methyltransferase (adenine-specific)